MERHLGFGKCKRSLVRIGWSFRKRVKISTSQNFGDVDFFFQIQRIKAFGKEMTRSTERRNSAVTKTIRQRKIRPRLDPAFLWARENPSMSYFDLICLLDWWFFIGVSFSVWFLSPWLYWPLEDWGYNASPLMISQHGKETEDNHGQQNFASSLISSLPSMKDR